MRKVPGFVGGMQRPIFRGCAILAAIGVVFPAAGQGRPVVRWQAGGHAAGVENVAYSPDGALAASASGDGTAKVWRAADGGLLYTFTNPFFGSAAIHSVQFSPDSESLVFTGTGGGFLVRLSDGAVLQTYCCLETGYASAFSPDGQYIAIGGSESGLEETTLLVRPSDGQVVRTFTKNVQHYVLSVAFTPDGSELITGSGSAFSTGTLGVIRHWRIADGVETRTINAHAARLGSIDVSPDGTLLASASLDGTAKLWELSSGALVRTLSGHTGGVNAVRFSPDGARVATSGVDSTIRVWEVATGTTALTIPGHAGPVGGIGWRPDGTRILSGGGMVFGGAGDATVREWDAASGTPAGQYTQHLRTLEAVAASVDGEYIATGGYDGAIVLRDARDGAVVRVIPTGAMVSSLAFTPDSSLIAAGGSDGAVRLFTVATGALVRVHTGHSASVSGLACSPDGAYVIAGDWDGPARVWRIDDGTPAGEFASGNVGARSIAFAPDGQAVAIAGGMVAQIRSFPAGLLHRTLAGHTHTVLSVAWSPGGDQVATGSIDRSIRIWNPATGALLRTLNGHEHWVETVAYTDDGRLLVSGNQAYEPSLRLWNPATGAGVAAYQLETGSGVYDAACLPGRGIAYVRRDAAAVVIEPPPPEVAGDWNYDGRVDGADFSALPACFTGPETDASENCVDAFDSDGDRDVDLADFGAFQAAFGG